MVFLATNIKTYLALNFKRNGRIVLEMGGNIELLPLPPNLKLSNRSSFPSRIHQMKLNTSSSSSSLGAQAQRLSSSNILRGNMGLLIEKLVSFNSLLPSFALFFLQPTIYY